MNYFRYAKEKPTNDVWLEQLIIRRHISLRISKVSGATTGITEEDGRTYQIGDRVELRADCDGFISSGITQEGMGKIAKLRLNGDVHYYILMDNGEKGWVTSRYIWKNHSESE